jgi:hypothetical protein
MENVGEDEFLMLLLVVEAEFDKIQQFGWLLLRE